MSKRFHAARLAGGAAVMSSLLSAAALAAPIISDGSDGAFNPTVSQTIDLRSVAPDGVFNFTSINIPTGVTIRFIANDANTPVFFAATGDVTIDGTIDVSASGRSGGVGGFDGGLAGNSSRRDGTDGEGLSPGLGGGGSDAFSQLGRAGGGGGMATAGLVATSRTGSPPAAGGAITAFPTDDLAGGSGGGGGGRGRFFGVDLTGGDGGGGGGAFQLSTPGDITLGGALVADGAHGGYAFANVFSHGGPGGGGSGGNFELNASRITVADGALISAIGGAGGGLSTEPVAFDPFFFSSGANGGLGYVLFDATVVDIDDGATIDAAALLPGVVTPGTDPADPVLPDRFDGPEAMVFDVPRPGLWYDPPLADGFVYTLSGDPAARFTFVDVPPASFGFGPVDLMVGGNLVATLSAGGGGFDFLLAGLLDVQSFSLVGIDPLLDTGSPDFASAFPTFLDWTGQPQTLTMTALTLPTSSAPEPGPAGLLAAAVLVAALRRRRV